ncbi:Ger(x)C family spore germination protein [Halobacillus litoralis]|uniref:Ger(x)C family spore germination protein n=1 Tax=Halobacillus litoralis TaxID=45668 RepID=UPI002493ACEF|nr:Ger(x)C family spore germination protein [Halobacillus litoralis]
MNNKTRLLLSIVLCYLLVGCMPNQSVEENAIIEIAGYDRGEEEKIEGTVSIPQYGRDEKKTSASELYLSVRADSVKDVEKEIQKQSSKPITIGKLAVTLYSEELAEEDISDIIDVLSRDPRLSRNMYIGIAEGEAKSLIEGGYTQDETTSKYLQGLIENNMHFNFPKTSLHDYLYAYYAEGMDGYLPILSRKNDYVELSGIGFLNNGKLVRKIPDSDVFVFKMMKENFKKGMQDLDFKEGTILMDNIGSHVEYRLKGTTDQPEFEIDVKMKAVVNEMVGIHQDINEGLAKEMEETFKDYYQKKANEMIQMFKEEKIDPLGLGHFAKSRRESFDLKKWEDAYPELPVNVKISVDITEYGIFS